MQWIPGLLQLHVSPWHALTHPSAHACKATLACYFCCAVLHDKAACCVSGSKYAGVRSDGAHCEAQRENANEKVMVLNVNLMMTGNWRAQKSPEGGNSPSILHLPQHIRNLML